MMGDRHQYKIKDSIDERAPRTLRITNKGINMKDPFPAELRFSPHWRGHNHVHEMVETSTEVPLIFWKPLSSSHEAPSEKARSPAAHWKLSGSSVVSEKSHRRGRAWYPAGKRCKTQESA